GWGAARSSRNKENPISSDFLYLRNPKDKSYYGFQFNVDFFAAAGDQTWWHDHRIPGGIAFTANSTGHMRYFRDWYERPGSDHGEWALKQAMITIAQAHSTKASCDPTLTSRAPQDEGKATWLRDLDSDGRPLLNEAPCPLKNVPRALQDKDWTRYEGL